MKEFSATILSDITVYLRPDSDILFRTNTVDELEDHDYASPIKINTLMKPN